MSYILDALKKSEEQRPPGTVPDLFAVHGPQAPAPRRNPWPLAAVALSLAAAGFAAWIGFRAAGGGPPVREEARSAAAAPAPVMALPAPAAPVSAAPAPAPARPKPAAPAPVAAREPVREIPLAPPLPKGETGGFDGRAESAAAQSPVETPAPAAPVVPGEAPVPPPDGTVLELAALPAAVRAELPAVAVTGHVWSEEPSLRMLILQDHILREGSEAAPGVRVEEITPEGAVLSFKGYRYRVAGF